MKSKIVNSALSVCMLAIFMLATTATFAQDKPAGKPWPVDAAAAKVKNPVKADDSSIASGKEIYATQCKSCHGAKGLGDGPKAEKIEITCGDFSSPEFQKMTDGELFYKTTEGRKPMPSFKEKLSDNERWAVVNYMRTLGKK
jgi:mono/diheme cytochrome c family protein